MEKREMLNRYTCLNCGKHITTINLEDGVTPAFVKCRFGCEALMRSHWYQVHQLNSGGVGEITHEWYRPDEEELKTSPTAVQEHVKLGGLLLRKHFGVLDMWRGNCTCGRWVVITLDTSPEKPIVCECGVHHYVVRTGDELKFFHKGAEDESE